MQRVMSLIALLSPFQPGGETHSIPTALRAAQGHVCGFSAVNSSACALPPLYQREGRRHGCGAGLLKTLHFSAWRAGGCLEQGPLSKHLPKQVYGAELVQQLTVADVAHGQHKGIAPMSHSHPGPAGVPLSYQLWLDEIQPQNLPPSHLFQLLFAGSSPRGPHCLSQHSRGHRCRSALPPVHPVSLTSPRATSASQHCAGNSWALRYGPSLPHCSTWPLLEGSLRRDLLQPTACDSLIATLTLTKC